jgi:adenosylmethionine-8-amino-7-oxononanoate aminotransferase
MTELASRNKNLKESDKRYIWHPFTQMKEWCDSDPLIISEGKGAYLKDMSGRWYIDGVSSLWTNVHGHQKEEIDNALKSQIDRIAHSTFLGLTNVPAIDLAERLVGLSPKRLKRVFYSDNGSTAVEVALKIAFQYHKNNGAIQRNRFVSLNNAYHGDTLGAVSVGGIGIFHDIFHPLLFESLKAPSPYCYRCELQKQPETCELGCLKEMEKIINTCAQEIAAVIVEPMVQGAGGMIVFPSGYLKGVEDLCRSFDILLITDEVATGFGRTGRMFACEHEDVQPDIMCLAKGITAGYLPLAATLTTEEIYNGFMGEYEELKTFFHGHTYTGNQLGCAAALASLDVFEKENTLYYMQDRIKIFSKGLDEIAFLEHVGQVRQCGFMVGIELVKDKDTRESFSLNQRIGMKVCSKAREEGLIIRPLGDLVVLMPPLCVSDGEINRIVEITADSIKKTTSCVN